MNKNRVDAFHRELMAAVKKVCDNYDMVLMPSQLKYGLGRDNDVSNMHKMIKVVANVPVEEARTADEFAIKHGMATANTRAWVTDRQGNRRQVMITERKLKKYGFYFADDRYKSPMLGHFHLFSANQ